MTHSTVRRNDRYVSYKAIERKRDPGGEINQMFELLEITAKVLWVETHTPWQCTMGHLFLQNP
jgi:hypothetical protein